MKQLTLKTSYMTPSSLGCQNNMPSSSTQAVGSQNLSSNKQQYQQSLLKKKPRRRSPYQQPSRNMRMCFLRKPPSNYHPLDHMTMPLNSRTHSCLNGPKLTHSILLNTKPAKSSSKNTSRQGKSPLQNLSKPHHFFFVKKKKAGKLCSCQDYWYLNSHTIKNAYPLPLISNLIDKLQGLLIFTKFDVWWGYNNVLIKPEDQWKAAFSTPLGLFEPNIMFFRMCNSPATFQAFMNDLFWDYIAEGWLVIYMADLLINSLNQELHDECTQKVLQHFWEQEMYLKLEKCTFLAKEVKYLRMIVGKGGIQMDPIKLKAIWEWSPLANIKAVWSFLGFCNFYGNSSLPSPISPALS